ncbi:MAG: NACHT domain-containing protein [Moorea sp. SIO4A3]|nr:NACHT domain-containing protein [Moorena sp. SIO4A3]
MVNWDPYLESIHNTYAQWWQVYTLTDVEGRKRKQQQQTPMLFNFDLMVQTMKEETERLPVLEGLRKYATDHVLLVGRPGSGKSTALVQLLADEGIQGKIPVLVELRYYQTSVLELVRNFLKRHGVLLDSTDIERLLFEGQFWLLIDGVNELPSEAARSDLTQFRQDYQENTPMIFTTRDLGVGGDLGIQKKLEMQPLSADQMSEFVRKYLPQQGEQMLNQLGDRLREFGQTPLLLMMLCALFQDRGEIPSNLGLVFRSFTQFYSKQIKQDVKVSDNKSRKFWPDLLQQLGFVMTTGDNPDKPEEINVAITKTKAEEILTNYLLKKAVVNPNVYAKTWLDDLLNHHLIQQSGELIEFRHQLIQEYYTAEYLLKQLPRLSDQQLQQNYLNYLKWTETLVLMLQLVDNKKQANRVVRLGLDVDGQLGARLAGAVKPKFQEDTVGLVARLEIPKLLKVELLGITGSEKAIPELSKCLDYDDSWVRMSATFALEKIGTEAAINPLIKLLDHDDYWVRMSAAFALGKIGTEATIDPLIKLLDDDNSNVRMSAADALGEIGAEATIDPLIKLLDHDNSNVRMSAADALGEIGTEATIDPLIKLLDDDNFWVRIRAAAALVNTVDALRNIGTEATIDPLIKLLHDDNSWVRRSAANALKKIGTEATIPKLMNLLNNEEFAATNDKDLFKRIINIINAIQERYQVYNPTYRPKPIPKPDPPKFIATQTIYILHLSDLHITTPEQAQNWSNQLAQDLTQDLQIPHLDALILSGDIANYSTPEEYQAAQQFLDNLCQDFPLDRKQIVLVPGNHDLNWTLATEAYELCDRTKDHDKLQDGDYIKVTDQVIRVRDETKYQQRFANFSQFYQAIKGQPYPLDYREQAIIDHFPKQNLLILGLNSAWQLDHHFKDRASIHSGALSKALTEIRGNSDYHNCLKIAVWHHPLNSARSDRITDQGFIEQLAVAGFRFFLHGHIHKAETSLFRYDLSPGGRKLDGICAGTFGAPTLELRTGYPWQYNLLKINGNQLTVYTRRREEENGAWKPDSRWTQGPGKSGLDYYSIEL